MADNGNPAAVALLELAEIEEGEVGELAHIQTPEGCFIATWLGTVSNGRELAEAMELMAGIARERELEGV